MSQARDIEDEINEALTNVVRDIGVNVVAELQETTPVDFGWARAGWWTDIGGNITEEPLQNPYDTGERENAESIQSNTNSELLNYQLEDGQVAIYNNVPYINVLNDGHSDQEPAGFVQRSIEKVLADL